jgi:photosynthetic reaction center cytochrome c subunit
MKMFALAAVTVVLVAGTPMYAQTNSSPSTQTSRPDQRSGPAPTPSNIKLLTGISQVELLRDMSFISASLGVSCDYCHVRSGEHLDFASDAKEEKGSAREMIEMVFAVNKSTFNGQTVVSCYTCHRGSAHPVNMVSLPLPPRAPATGAAADASAKPERPSLPAAEEIFSRYVTAIGGPSAAARLRAAHSYSMVGTRTGGEGKPMSIRVDRSLPSQVMISMDRPDGTRVEQVLTETGGWMRNGKDTRDLRPNDSERIRDTVRSLDDIFLPATDPAGFRVRRKDKIDDREVWILDRNLSDTRRQSLYFDAQSGLLVREVIVTDQKIGRVAAQMDFSDYRDVNGVKLPFVTRTSSIDPRNDGTSLATEILLDPAIDPARFAAPPKTDH